MCIGLPPHRMLSSLGQMLDCLQCKGSRTLSSTCHLHGNVIKIIFCYSLLKGAALQIHMKTTMYRVWRSQSDPSSRTRGSNRGSCPFPTPQTHANACTENAPHFSPVHAEPQSKILIEGFKRIKEGQRGESETTVFCSAVLT